MTTFPGENSITAEIPALATPSVKSRRTRNFKIIPFILVFLSLAVLLYLDHNNIRFSQKSTLSPSWNDESASLVPKSYVEDEIFEPLKRYSHPYGKVACWQDNGVWIKQLSSVEMAGLGVDRFQDTDRALNQTEEDAFCMDLRMYGARFWELPPQWPEHVNWCEDIDACVKPTREVNFEMCFPASGGLWMLDTSQGWDRLYPKISGLQKSLTMDERCEVIKGLGGRFCEDIQACPEMADLLGTTERIPDSL